MTEIVKQRSGLEEGDTKRYRGVNESAEGRALH